MARCSAGRMHRLTKRGAEPWSSSTSPSSPCRSAIIDRSRSPTTCVTHWGFLLRRGARTRCSAPVSSGRAASRSTAPSIGGADRRVAPGAPVDRHPLLDLRGRSGARSAPRPGHRPLRQLVQPGALAGLPTGLLRGVSRSTIRATPPCRMDLPRGTLFHPRSSTRCSANAPGRARPILWAGRRFRLQVGPPVRACTWSGTAPVASSGSRSASIPATSSSRTAHQRVGRHHGVVLGLVIIFVQKAPPPRNGAVALCARSRVERRKGMYNRRTPTTSST